MGGVAAVTARRGDRLADPLIGSLARRSEMPARPARPIATAVNLGGAAQAVGVLDAAASDVGGADLAAFDQGAEVPGAGGSGRDGDEPRAAADLKGAGVPRSASRLRAQTTSAASERASVSRSWRQPTASMAGAPLSNGGSDQPRWADGLITGSVLRRPLQDVRLTIGGQAAEVLYAGSAPGLVSGVLQVNARVPQGIAAGNAAVILIVGGAASQAGVTLAVEAFSNPRMSLKSKFDSNTG